MGGVSWFQSSKAIFSRDSARLAVLAGACLLLAGVGWQPLQKLLYAWELETLTVRQRWYPPQPRGTLSPITLLNVDQGTLANTAYNQRFDWLLTRRAVGYAVRFLKRTTPRAVYFDFAFNGNVKYQAPMKGDAFLLDSVSHTTRDHSPVTSNLDFENQQANPLIWDKLPLRVQQSLRRQQVTVQGHQRFPQFGRQGNYNHFAPTFLPLMESPMRFFSDREALPKTDLSAPEIDSSNIIRRWLPFAIYNGAFYPTQALGLALNGEKHLTLSPDGVLSWPQHQLHLGQDGLPLFKWYGHGVQLEHPVYPEFSFGDAVMSEIVLECRENPSLPDCGLGNLPARPPLDPSQFKDRYVLIGTTLTDDDDHVTIYSNKYPGIYIVANALDNVLHDDFVRPAPFWLNMLMILALPGLFFGAIVRYRAFGLSLLLTLTLSAGYFFLCLHAYHSWNLWLVFINPVLALVTCFTGFYLYRYTVEARQRQQMHVAFGKYVSPAVLQLIEQHPEQVKLGGERREMSFLFSDIRGFTAFSEQNPPEVMLRMLTQYFSTMNGIILNTYQGTINKLIGDAIMAYWGFPLDNEDHAFLAVSAALAMRDAMMQWPQQEGALPISIGIGINTGDATVGNIGSDDFMDFTVIGDAVNVAARLESLNREFGTHILISASTYAQVKDRIEARSCGMVTLKGRLEPVEVFEPIRLL